MTLPDTLVIEQPWHTWRHLWGAAYEIAVYDERDAPLATVRERARPRLLRRALRRTGFSGRTRFELVLAAQGRPLLFVDKGVGKPPTRVSRPDGVELGAVRREGRRYALLDLSGQRICLLDEVAEYHMGHLTKRNGRRVRRDVVRLRPGVPEPLRSLAIAAGVASDVVRGVGTKHFGGGGWDFPAG